MKIKLKPVSLKLISILALLTIGAFMVKAQDTLLVKGKIVNGAQEPVSNVVVAVEGSADLPGVTDSNGEFSIKTPFRNGWLNIEPSEKYNKKRIYLNGRNNLTIYLTEKDVESGDEPLNILSQSFLKRDIISSFDDLNTTDILYTPAFSVDQYMQGRGSGMYVVNRSGDQWSGAETLLRGINSINSKNQPLYIVDGIPLTSMHVFNSNLAGFTYNPLLGLNPLDITKAVIIKDPTITSAYGSKASNGLVLIETLNPSATKTVIDFDFRIGYSLAPSKLIPQMNAGQHKTLINELLFTSGSQEEFIRENYSILYLTPEDENYIDYQHNTDWQDLIFSNSTYSNININVKGGDEIARYGLSFGYTNGDGIVKSTGYQGYNLRFVSLLNIFSWLKMSGNVSLCYNLMDLKESAKVHQTNPILASLGKSPMLNPYQYDEEGNELIALADVDELGVSNPLAIIENYSADNKNFYFITSLGLEASLKENLSLKSNLSLTYNLYKEHVFMPNRGMELYYSKEAHNVAKAANNVLSSIYNNTFLLYNKKFNNDHKITSNTGAHVLTNNFEYDWALTKNAHKNDQYRLLQDGTFYLREKGGENRRWHWVSFYENLTYNFRDKYIGMLTVSIDGSSRVGDNAQNTVKIGGIPWGVFYSAGAAWRLSNESFLKDKSWLEEFKIRVSYGQSGNDDIGESNASKYYSAIKYRETIGLYPAMITNEELTYETVTQLNGGLDISLWGNRLGLSADVYRSTIDNMLIYSPLNPYLGYSFRPENNGKMQNNGIDMNLFCRIINHTNFKWDVNANFSTFTNQILEIKGEKLITEIEGASIVNMVGESANSFYGYVFEGVYSTEAEANEAALVNDKLLPYHAGDAIYADLSGPDGSPDHIINNYDKKVIGSSLPNFFGGIRNSFKYKRWMLNIFLQGTSGNEVFNYIRYQNENMVGLENQSINVLNRWQFDGQVTDIPRAYYGDPVGNSMFSTRWIEDGSLLRVKNITLSYAIPDNFLTFRNAEFYVSANNIVSFSKYLGYDPEFSHSRAQIEQGVDYGLTPQQRQFIVGVKLGL